MTATDVEAAAEPEPQPEKPASSGRPLTKRFLIALGIIVFAALAVRAGNVLFVRETVGHPTENDYYLNGDAFYYHWQAVAIGEGQFFVNPAQYAYVDKIFPSATHPPLYSSYLGAFSAIGLDGVTDHRLASCLLGTITVGLVGLFCRRLGGDRVGLIAAAIAAFYPQFWINDGMLLSETGAQFATILMLIATYSFWRRRTLGSAAWFGAATALVVLSRPELSLLFPFVVLPLGLLVWKTKPWKDRLKPVVVAGLVGAFVLAPWITFNMTRGFNHTVTLSTGPWTGISAGACDEVWYGEFIGYYANCFRGPFPAATADESEREILPGKAARKYIEDHLSRIPVVVLARIGRLWNVFKPGQNTWLDWWLEGRGKGASWAGLFMYYALWPFAIAGFLVMRRRKIPVLPIVAYAVIVTIAVAITFGVTRYRAPFEVCFVVLAAFGVDQLWRWWRRRGGVELEPPPTDYSSDVIAAAQS